MRRADWAAPLGINLRLIGRGKGLVLGGSGGAYIALSANSLPENSAEGTAIGTLSTVGTTGTAAFTLVDSASNKVKLAGVNNVNVQAGASASDYETTPTFQFTVSVSGVTPAIGNTTFTVAVSDVAESGGAGLLFNDVDNSQYIGQVV